MRSTPSKMVAKELETITEILKRKQDQWVGILGTLDKLGKGHHVFDT